MPPGRVAAAGAVWVHPSAAVSIVLTGLMWWAGQLVSPWGRRWLRPIVVPLLVAGVVGAVLLVPAVGPGLVTAGRTGAFPPDISPTSFRDAVGNTFGFPFWGWIDPTCPGPRRGSCCCSRWVWRPCWRCAAGSARCSPGPAGAPS